MTTLHSPQYEKVAIEGYLVAPEYEDAGHGVVLVCEHATPNQPVIPADGDAKCFVHESIGQIGECSTGWVEGRHFPKRLHDAECDDTDDAKADQQRCRTAIGEGSTCADEETRTDDTCLR